MRIEFQDRRRRLSGLPGMKEPESILGGESVYCINQVQLTEAMRLYESDPHSSPRLKKHVDSAQTELSRNEQAALAFVLIERLRTSAE